MAIVTIIAFGCYKSYDFYKHNKTQEKQTRAPQTDSSQKAFVILICAYNNAKYCEKNLFSAITQRYKNFRIVYIDDASTDGSFAMVSRMASRSDLTDRISLIKNSENKGALASLYNAVHTCKDHEIIVPVDGNDFLAHENVLLKLNKAYAKPATWMTYGNFLDYPSYRQSPMKCRPISKNIVFNNAFRSHEIHDMYLKTFYAALFRQIKKEDLLYKDHSFFKRHFSVFPPSSRAIGQACYLHQ